MEETFYSFCDSTKKGSRTATDKTLKKICTDCKIYSSKLNANSVDIALRKHLGNQCKEMTYDSFMNFINTHLSDEYSKANGVSKDQAIEQIKNKISGNKPQGHGTTGTSGDAATARLTDVKGYTGSHVQRFDAETGKGKGIDGREDRAENSGYVGEYKGQGTYDKTH